MPEFRVELVMKTMRQYHEDDARAQRVAVKKDAKLLL